MTEDIIKEQALSLVPIVDSPDINEMWSVYLSWAKLNKKSWKDDQIRWTKHIASFMPTKVNQITQKDHIPILPRMASKGYAQATVRQVFVLVKRVINWSIKNGIYPRGIIPFETWKRLK
ncbi:hypothetical protein [Desulfospira joergensenii]|uniref:hypothetical protein n=1 Tax=Desulfospira joergensenii TaxID=53329 RepID=UPI0003B48F5C|nr:hypothetical protein [Desulfospira joergensenii]